MTVKCATKSHIESFLSRGSAFTNGLCNHLCQLKSCRLLQNSTTRSLAKASRLCISINSHVLLGYLQFCTRIVFDAQLTDGQAYHVSCYGQWPCMVVQNFVSEKARQFHSGKWSGVLCTPTCYFTFANSLAFCAVYVTVLHTLAASYNSNVDSVFM